MYTCMCVCVCLPEQPDAETDHHVVEGVEAHHAHQQVLQNHLQIERVASHLQDDKYMIQLFFTVLCVVISFRL